MPGSDGDFWFVLLWFHRREHERVTFTVFCRDDRLTDVYDAKVLTPLLA